MPTTEKRPDDAARAVGATYSPDGTPWLMIVNWVTTQKYKEANPPWFILCTSLRKHGTAKKNGKGWVTLSDASRSLLINLWLLAAEQTADGLLWGDPAFLVRQMPLNGPLDLTELIEAEFVRYVDDAEAEQVRAQAAEKHKAKKRTTKARAGAPSASKAKKPKTEERRGEAEQRIAEESTGSGASQRVPSSRAPSERVTGHPVDEEPQSQGQPQSAATGQTQTQGADAPDTSTHPCIIPFQTPAPEPPAQPAVPANPKEPEAGGATGKRRSRRRSRPPRASLGVDARLLGHSLHLHWDDPESVAFGQSIFELLWPGRSGDSDDAQSEIGAFGSLYFEKIRTRVPALELPHFRVRCMEKARHIAKNGKGCDRKGAVFTSIVYDMLGMSSRASPAG